MKDDELKDVARSPEEFDYYKETECRRLYLFRAIDWINDEGMGNIYVSQCGRLIQRIMQYNREDLGKEPEDRKPILLYISCPGGDLNEGLGLVGAIETSKTPVYTINVGQWSSMAFLIGIAGDKRFALPYTSFLMHDGNFGVEGTTNKVLDTAAFMDKVEKEIIKKLVIKHSNMRARDYNKYVKIEYYMLPKEALEWGFIDRIVNDIDEIL